MRDSFDRIDMNMKTRLQLYSRDSGTPKSINRKLDGFSANALLGD